MEESKKTYEIAFLLDRAEGVEGLKKSLASHDVVIKEESPVAERELAYAIKKHNRAFFGFITFLAKPDIFNSLEDQIRMNPEVLRFLIVAKQEIAPKRLEKEMRPQEKTKPVESTALSNEDLAQKLEEILQ